MDINNIQALIAQGLLTDVASVDPNKAYVAVGVYQPGNRQSGPAGNAYPSYAMPISEFLSGAGVLTGAQNGLSLAGTVAELGGTLIHTTDVNINGYSMQFSNGVYPILFLDPGKQQVAIGGNNPKGMLDITAVGSGTIGLQLNTASTQDAKIHFRTNNAAAARAQVYVEDASQTLNVYTVNSDTIFWNGNGLAQTKTFTLFTDTTAKFENNIGIGADPVTNGRVQINNSVFGKASISLGGADYYGIDVNTTGLSMLLGVNTSNNKQLWLADQDKLASNGTNPILQFGLFGTSPSAINAISTNGSYLDLVLQSNGGNVGISTGVINPTARLHVKGNSAPGDSTFKAEDAGGNPLLYVRNDGNVGIGTITPTAKLDVNGQIVSGLGGGVVTSNDSPFYAVRANTGAPNYYTGWQYTFEVGGGIWGIGMNYVNNQFQFLTNGASTGKFIFGDGNPATPNGKFLMDLNGGYFGSNTTSPTATIHGKGIDSTSSNYALKLDNSASSPLLYVRNDQSVTMNGSVTWGKLSGFDYLWIGQGSSNLSTNYSLAYNTGYLILNSTSALPILVRRENSDGSGLVPMMDFGNSSIPNIIKLNDMYGVGISTSKLLLNTDSLGSVQMGIFNGTTVTGKFIFNNQDTTAGFGILNPSATAHIQGDATSSNYALKVDNSSASPLLYVRNDGLISAPLLPTSNAGLSTGDMYVDTAANILANGDKVVGWKV